MRKLVLLLLLVPFLPLSAVEEEVPSFPYLRSKEFITADFDALLKRWADFIEKNPNSYVSWFLLKQIDDNYDRMTDWRGVEPALEKALAAKLTNGFLSYAYKKSLQEIYRTRGLRERADALNAFEGAVTDFFYVGSFGTELGDGAVFETFEPETDVLTANPNTLKKEYLSFDGTTILRWRKPVVHKPLESPYVHFETQGYGGLTYAVAQFVSQTECDALLHFSADSYIKVFFNGHPVYEFDSERHHRPNTVILPVRVRKGHNQILLKTTQYSVKMFLRDLKGFPLKGLSFETEPVLHPVKVEENPRFEGEYEKGLLDYYRKRYEKNPDDVDTAIAYAYLLRGENMDIRALEVLEDALKKNPEDPILCYFAARMYDSAYHCPEAWRHSKARTLIEKALKKEKHFVIAREMLSEFLVQKERHEKAVEVLRGLLEAGIKRMPIYQRIANICSQKSWVREQIQAVKAAEALNPNARWVLSFWSGYYAEGGNTQKAREFERRYYELFSGGDSYALYKARIAEEDGNIDEAIRIYQEFARRYPKSTRYKFYIAQLLEQAGRYREAIRYYKILFEEHPDQVNPTSICESLARLYRLLGDREGAVEWLQKLLLFSPADWSTRRYIQYLKGEEEDFSKEYSLSEDEIEGLMKESPTAEMYPRSNILTLLDEEITLVLPSGATSSYTHTIEKLLKEEGKEELGVTWGGGEIKILRTVTPDGKKYEPTPMGYGFAMTNLCKGAFVEKKYRGDGYSTIGLETTSWHEDNFLSFYRPCHCKRIVIIFKKGRYTKEQEELLEKFGRKAVYPAERLKLRLRNFVGRDNLSFEVLEKEDSVVYIFTAKELKVEEQERATVPQKEIFPNMEFVAEKKEPERSFCKLKGVLRNSSVVPTRLIREQARKITEGADTLFKKVRRLYDWCHKELKEGGYASHAHAILIEKAGDRNTLFWAFLNALEIPYSLVVSTYHLESGGAEEWEKELVVDNFYTSTPMFLFEEGGERLFATLDIRYIPLGKVPESYQGAPAFIVNDDELRFIYLPREPLHKRMEEKVTMEIDLATQTCTGRCEYRSAYYYERKSEYAKRSKEDLRRELEMELGARFPGMRLKSFDLPELKTVGTPLIIEFVCEVPTLLVKRADGNYDINTFIKPLLVQRRYAGKPERKYPMKIYQTYINDEVSTVKLSDDYEVVSIPKTEIIDSPFGFYSLSFSFDEQQMKIKVGRYFAIYAPRISLNEYPDFLKFARRIDELEMRRIVVKKKSTDE